MFSPGPGQIGRLLILTGLVIILTGLLVMLLGRLGLFHLPGDLKFGGKNWHVFIPVTSSIIISVLLTLILLLINSFRK